MLKSMKTFISGLSSAGELSPCMYVCHGSKYFRNRTNLNATIQKVSMSIVNSAEFSKYTVFVLWL